jgi:NAD(P)-dependent dehydrogenase (short-subunit alcohol dehydrogenase family)
MLGGNGNGLALLLACIAALPYLISILLTPQYAVHSSGIIVVTGASSGIGKSASIALAKEGYTVWAGTRKQADVEALQELGISGLLPIILDITRVEDMERLLQDLSKAEEPLVGLVNNAGVAIGSETTHVVEKQSMQHVRRVMEVNYFGTVSLTSKLLPLLRASKGRIVNISSVSGFYSVPGMQPYSASKHALEAFSDSLRREVNSFPVSVSVVQPGYITTRMTGSMRGEGFIHAHGEGMEEYEHVYKTAKIAFLKSCEAAEILPEASTTPAILHAIQNSRPRTRYLVGFVGPLVHARLVRLLASLVPDRLMDFFLEYYMSIAEDVL